MYSQECVRRQIPSATFRHDLLFDSNLLFERFIALSKAGRIGNQSNRWCDHLSLNHLVTPSSGAADGLCIFL
jgi:hypothetical protein